MNIIRSRHFSILWAVHFFIHGLFFAVVSKEYLSEEEMKCSQIPWGIQYLIDKHFYGKSSEYIWTHCHP